VLPGGEQDLKTSTSEERPVIPLRFIPAFVIAQRQPPHRGKILERLVLLPLQGG
jgi:hypothetical protein